MKRVISLMMMSLLLIFALPVTAHEGHDEGTPAVGEFPDSFEIAPGVTADQVVFREDTENPVLYRLHFEPGVIFPVEPSTHLEIASMEAGSLTLQLDGPAFVGDLTTSGAEGEIVPANTEITVSAGQYLVLKPGVGGEVRNDGEETATVSVAGVVLGGMATPEAATPAG